MIVMIIARMFPQHLESLWSWALTQPLLNFPGLRRYTIITGETPEHKNNVKNNDSNTTMMSRWRSVFMWKPSSARSPTTWSTCWRARAPTGRNTRSVGFQKEKTFVFAFAFGRVVKIKKCIIFLSILNTATALDGRDGLCWFHLCCHRSSTFYGDYGLDLDLMWFFYCTLSRLSSTA